MGLAGDALIRAGFETYGHVMKGTGHGIAPDGLSVALAFLQDRLPRVMSRRCHRRGVMALHGRSPLRHHYTSRGLSGGMRHI